MVFAGIYPTNSDQYQDLREALAHLGDITGETMNEHVIDRVFSDFCVGK